jgi:hypothetical protein
MKKLLILVLILIPTIIFAYTTSSEFTYDEPVSNADGTALNDLSHVSIYYYVLPTDTPIKAKDVPATKLTGGGKDVPTGVVTYTVPDGTAQTNFFAIAVDISGNRSARSNIAIRNVSNVILSSPTGLNITQ